VTRLLIAIAVALSAGGMDRGALRL
jgi:hypothetical protein